MGDLAGTLRHRVLAAQHNLSQARMAGDDYGAEVYAAELEDLLRRAAAYQITIEPADSSVDPAPPGARS